MSRDPTTKDDPFEEFRHVNGALVRADGEANEQGKSLGDLDSSPWMQRREKPPNGKRGTKRARATLLSPSEEDFVADDGEDESESESESESELSDNESESESASSLGSASAEDEGLAGMRGYGGRRGEDFSIKPAPSDFKAVTTGKPKAAAVVPRLKFSIKGGVAAAAAAAAAAKTVSDSMEEASLESGSSDESDESDLSDESESEDLAQKARNNTKAQLDALAAQAREARSAPSWRDRERHLTQRDDDDFDDYRPDKDDWQNAGEDGDAEDDRAYEECLSLSKRLKDTLKEAQSAEKGKVPVFSVDNAVEATGGVKSGTFATQLKPYQMVGVNFLMLLQQNDIPGAILADEMGLGKTAQAISFIAMSRYDAAKSASTDGGVLWPRVDAKANPVLVVSPASLLENWKRELGMWAPNLKVGIFHGDNREEVRNTEEYHREQTRECCYDVIVVCYSLFERDSAESQDNRAWLQRMEFSHLILDEAHLLKNREAQRTTRLTRLARKAHYRLLLTGTPLQNTLRELEALIDFVLPGLLKEGELGEGIDDEQAERRVKKVRRILEPFVLRRLKETVATQLAPKTQVKEVITMTEGQAATYKVAVDRIRREASEGKSTSNGVGLTQSRVKAIFVHLRKVANHPLLVRHRYTDQDLSEIVDVCHRRRIFGPDARLERVKEHVEGLSDFSLHQLCGDYMLGGALKDKMLEPDLGLQSAKVQRLKELLLELKAKGSRPLIFSQWKIMLDILEWALSHLGYTYARLDGDTVVEDRQDLVDKFNAKQSPIFAFLLSTRAGGQGLNLTGADTVILHDVDFNPQIDRQAEDRCHRLGQEKNVTVYRLVTKDSVDEKIVAIAEQKMHLDAAVLDEGPTTADGKSKDETRAMQKIIEELVASG